MLYLLYQVNHQYMNIHHSFLHIPEALHALIAFDFLKAPQVYENSKESTQPLDVHA